MPEPVAVTVGASGALAFFVVIIWATVIRRRDPVGRAIAGHAHLLAALHDSATRSASAPAEVHDAQLTPSSVTIIPSTADDDHASATPPSGLPVG